MRIATAAGADLAATPELALVGYLPRDLLLSEGFVARSWDAVESLARDAAGLAAVLVGLPEPNPSDEGRPLFNSAVLLRGGRVEQRFRKALLPTYDVFDEDRYFEPFHGAQVLDIARHAASASASARTSGTTATSGSGAATITIRSTSSSRAGADGRRQPVGVAVLPRASTGAARR